jgi:thymidylate synthase
MEQYHAVLKQILGKGDVQYEPRTQEYILGISASQSTYDLREGFPLMTTKNVPPRLPFEELFWKLRGERNVKGLVDRNVNIWTANAFDRYLKVNGWNKEIPKHSKEWNEGFARYSERIKEDPIFAKNAGDLGPVYGYQWRHWGAGNDLLEFYKRLKSTFNIDLFERVPELIRNENLFDKKEIDHKNKMLKGIKERPGSRYHALSAWNVADLEKMALGPCPFWHQFSVFGNKFLDLTVSQRSNDIYLGVPFNIAQDALFLELVANETGLQPRYFNHQTVNTHAYLGVPPRANFWMNEENVKEFQNQFREIKERDQYPQLKEWYLKNAPSESDGNERKDHIPYILEQLSKEPRALPSLRIKQKVPFMEAINMAPLDIVEIINYNPHKWDSKATMAS